MVRLTVVRAGQITVALNRSQRPQMKKVVNKYVLIVFALFVSFKEISISTAMTHGAFFRLYQKGLRS